jgi:hypothetical protein
MTIVVALRLRTPISVYMTGLAVWDTLYLLFQTVYNILWDFFRVDIR